MAFQAGICYQFKQDLFNGVHNFSSNTFKIALYTQAGATTLNNTTLTTYTTTGEVTGTGYTAGGVTLSGVSEGISSGVAYVTWTVAATWPGSTITSDSALIYNSTSSNKAVAIFAFTSTSSSGNTFTVTFPTQTLALS